MSEKMRVLNILSAISFLISSSSLFSMSFIDIGNDLPKTAYVIAAIFWIGLLAGTTIQLCLSLKCRKMKLHSKLNHHKIPLFGSTVSFLFLMLLIILESQSKTAIIVSLAISVSLLQTSVIIKRKGCLK